MPNFLALLRCAAIAACTGLGIAPSFAADPLALEASRLINALRERAVECGTDELLPEETAQPRLASLASAYERPRLVWNPQLAAAAEEHGHAMAAQAFFDHVDPEGRTVAQRSSAAGYRWRVIGENLAAGQPDLPGAVADWLASPGHCRNLVDGRFTEFGIARVSSVYPTDPYGVYWVLVLGRPRAIDVASRPIEVVSR